MTKLSSPLNLHWTGQLELGNLGEGGGGTLKDHICSKGGGQDGPKKDRIIF